MIENIEGNNPCPCLKDLIKEMQNKKQTHQFSLLNIIMIWALVFVMFFSMPITTALSRDQISDQISDVIHPEIRSLINDIQADEKISVIVTLKDQADLSKVSPSRNSTHLQTLIDVLKGTAENSQKTIIPLLNIYQRSSEVEDIVQFWIFNGFSITATPSVIENFATHPDVLSIRPDQIELIPSATGSEVNIQDNLSLINAPLVWERGWKGQGVVVASMDTGVDLNHPDLREKWRGGQNSWYDPFGEHDIPTDLNGHGTMTTGVILGGDASGNAIGVAPQAEWIAVKIFDDGDSSTATAVHLGYQWLLDPDNDPETNDAPHIVNNSWSFLNPGCNTEFLLDIQALYAAGITSVFSAGNFGPNEGTSVSPANYPESFSVGAVTNEDMILGLSSRGPSMCVEDENIYPDITAPGYDIYTSDLYGFFTTATGTSLAAPHVTGSIALLLSAFPFMNVEDQKSALVENAVDLGEPGPDNVFGHGRVDVFRSYQAICESYFCPIIPTIPTPLPITNSFQYYLPMIKGD
jgi:subtilisin family serine protease